MSDQGSMLSDLLSALAEYDLEDPITKVYVWGRAPKAESWLRAGRILIHPDTWRRVTEVVRNETWSSSDKLFGIPVVHVRSAEHRREVFMHFFTEFADQAALEVS